VIVNGDPPAEKVDGVPVIVAVNEIIGAIVHSLKDDPA